jgi:hypothetical protein
MRRQAVLLAGLAAGALVGGFACERSVRARGDDAQPPPAAAGEAGGHVTDSREPPKTPWPNGKADASVSVGERKVYTRDDLSDYIDGGAAFYLAYSFEWLAVWDVTVQGPERRAVVELYRFTNAEDALGVLMDRAPDAGYRKGFERGIARKGSLRAQKGLYFVRIATPDRSEAGDTLVRHLGNLMSAALPEAKTKLPSVCASLPTESMRPGSVRYFHTKESLDSVHYLADENLLGLSAETQCGLASYGAAPEGKAPAVVLLMAYPGADAARTAFETFCRRYLECEPPAERKTASARVEDDTWAAGAWSDAPPSLAIVLGAAAEDWAGKTIEQALARYREAQP